MSSRSRMLYFGIRCLMRLFSSASASTTESVTIVSRPSASSSSASVFGCVPAGTEVAADTIAERAGLADVNRLAPLEEEVDAGLLGEPIDPALEIMDGHGLPWFALCAACQPPIITNPAHRRPAGRDAPAGPAHSTFTGFIGKACNYPLRGIICAVRQAAHLAERPHVRRHGGQRHRRCAAWLRAVPSRRASSSSSPTSSTSSTARWPRSAAGRRRSAASGTRCWTGSRTSRCSSASSASTPTSTTPTTSSSPRWR